MNNVFNNSNDREEKENCIFVFFELGKYNLIKNHLLEIMNDQYMLFHIAEEIPGDDLLFLFLEIIKLDKEVPKRENSILNILNSNNDFDGLYIWNPSNINQITEIVNAIRTITIKEYTVDNLHYIKVSNKNRLFKYYLKFNVPTTLIDKELFQIAEKKILSRKYNLAYRFLSTFDSKFNSVRYIELLLNEKQTGIDCSADRFYKLLINELEVLLKNDKNTFFILAEKFIQIRVLAYLSVPLEIQFEISKKRAIFYYFQKGPQKAWMILSFRKPASELFNQYPKLGKVINDIDESCTLPEISCKNNCHFAKIEDYLFLQQKYYKKRSEFPILINNTNRNIIIELQHKFFPKMNIHTQIDNGFKEMYIKDNMLYFPIYKDSDNMYVAFCKKYYGPYVKFSWAIKYIKCIPIKKRGKIVVHVKK